MNLVGDLEADDLIKGVTTIWCGVFKDVDTKEVYTFRPHQVHLIPELLERSDQLIIHNGVQYDREVLIKVLGYTYPLSKVWDSLIMSRLLNPDRKTPKGAKGAHSLQAWGLRFNHPKPVHEDWSKFSEDMLHRCTEDVMINEKVYYQLLKEMG